MGIDVKELTKPSVLTYRSGVRPTAIKPSRRSVQPSDTGESPVPQAKTALVNTKPDVPGLVAKVDRVA
jgi:hypothetical protein